MTATDSEGFASKASARVRALDGEPDFTGAVCRSPNTDPDQWFSWPGSDTSREAKALCLSCPIYWECAEYALAEGIPEGIFGGLDGRDRATIWSRTPGGKPTKFVDAIDHHFTALLLDHRVAVGTTQKRAS